MEGSLKDTKDTLKVTPSNCVFYLQAALSTVTRFRA